MDGKFKSEKICSLEIFGKNPLIGLSMFFIGGIIFALIAYNLVNFGPLMKWDLPLAYFFHSLALKSSPLIINIMIAGYYIGTWGIALIGVILGIYFVYNKLWCKFFTVLITLGFSGLIFLFISNIFMRPRPFLLFKEQIWPSSPNIPGFLSGHTLSIIVCCGLLVYFLIPKIKSNFKKILFVLSMFLIVLFVGFSRLYIGDHYLTDIITGYAIGVAWFGLAVTSTELYFKNK